MKILYFYPENPTFLTQGNNSRAFSLLQYFQSRSIKVHLVSEESSMYSDIEMQKIVDSKLIEKGYLIKRVNRKKSRLKCFFFYSLPNFLFNRIKQFNRVRFGHKNSFDEILKKNSYDYIIISYVYWSKLITNNKYLKNAKLIIDTHDLLTSQFQNVRRFKLGSFFQKEIEMLDSYDTIIAISVEEAYIYSQFIKKNIELIQHSIPNGCFDIEKSKKYDILYVASDNSHNKLAAKWFFEKVYPLLDSSLKIVVIGKITDCFADYSNVDKVRYTEELANYYLNAKIAICPMLSGTGLKIKVVEAMSFGLPIVCNERGIDGLINKTNNGCLVTNDSAGFANYIHRLQQDSSFYKTHSNQAKEFFLENHSISKTYSKLDTVFGL